MPDLQTIAAVASAIIAVFSAVVSIIFANKAQSAQSGTLELEIRNSLRGTKTRVSDLGLAHLETLQRGSADPKYAVIKQAITHAVEENINAYDEACAKYLDGKVDRIRFKKMYQTEVRELVEDSNHKEYFGRTSRYHALVSVYEEWENKPKSG